MFKIVLLLLLLAGVLSAHADVIHGRVVGAEAEGTVKPIAGATVTWKNTSAGAFTDSLGRFTLNRVPGADTLIARHVGYADAIYVVLPHDTTHLELSMELPEARQEIVVTGERGSLSQAAIRTEVITAKDLTRAACCSLAESFEKSPTVEVTFSDAVSGARQIQLLGLRGIYTQFLTEAVPVIRGLEVPWGLDHIPGPFMEGISVSKGAATVVTGYEAMTGLINIEYRKPLDAEAFYLNMYGNSIGRREINLSSAANVGEGWSTMTMVHGRIFDAEVDQNSDGFLDMPKFRQLNGLHRWMWFSDKLEMQALFRGLTDDYSGGQHGATFSPIKVDSSRYRIRTSIERYEGFLKLGLLELSDVFDESSLAVVVNMASQSNRSAVGLRLYDAKQTSATVRLLSAITFSPELSLASGLSFQFDDIAESIGDFNYSRVERVPGIYSEATIRPYSPLTLVIGTRLDQHNLYGSFFTPRMHVRWQLQELTTLRASAGKGYRVPVVVSENYSTFITEMPIDVTTVSKPEMSWNYGTSLTHSFLVNERVILLDAEVYHTEFITQYVPDYDTRPGSILVGYLDGGRSYSTSYMARAELSPFRGFDMGIAYRYVNVKAETGGISQIRPMLSRERVLVTLAYETFDNEWQYDATLIWNGGGRLPSTANHPTHLQRGDSFPGFFRINGQISYKFPWMDLYAGVENATNFFQDDPIMSPDQPFSKHFDASMMWGPMDPRIIYLGFRYRIQ